MEAVLLWHLRVLAGWQPRVGADLVRLLAAGFEVRNVQGRPEEIAGGRSEPAFVLGSCETAWSRLVRARSEAELRRTLAASAWGDPGAETPQSLVLGMALSWADRVVGAIPEAATWARSAAALLLIREAMLAERAVPEPLRHRAAYVVGPAFVDRLVAGPATSAELAALAGLLPAGAGGVLAGVGGPDDVWLAEAAWWAAVDRDAALLLRRARFGPASLVGAVARLAVDAWRVRAALETAARGGGGQALEVFDEAMGASAVLATRAGTRRTTGEVAGGVA